MTQLKSEELEKEAVRVAAIMASSARTAPKARGFDVIETMIVDGDDPQILAGAIEDKAKSNHPIFLQLIILVLTMSETLQGLRIKNL